MSTLMVLAEVFDSLTSDQWVEIQEDFNLPVTLGIPSRTVDEEGKSTSKDGLIWCVWDDPRIIEDQALAFVEAFDGK